MTQQFTPEQSPPTLPTANPAIRLEMPRNTRGALNGVLMALVLANLITLVVQTYLPNPATNGQMASTVNPPISSPRVVTDQGKRVSLTLSSEWKVEGVAGVLIHAVKTPRENLAVLVFEESKAELIVVDPRYSELDTYAGFMRSLLLKEMPDGTNTAPVRSTIDGFPAIQSDVTGTLNGVKVTFLHTIFSTPETYYQVRALATASEFPSARTELAKIVASFRVQGGRPAKP